MSHSHDMQQSTTSSLSIQPPNCYYIIPPPLPDWDFDMRERILPSPTINPRLLVDSPLLTLQAFHLFPQLPSEIRLQIWTWSLPRPRSVPDQELKRRYHRRLPQISTTGFPNSYNPSLWIPLLRIAHVNHESRCVFQHFFTLPSAAQNDLLDFKFDEFFVRGRLRGNLEEGRPMSLWFSGDLKRIQNAVFTYDTFQICEAKFSQEINYYIDEGLLPNVKVIKIEIHVNGVHGLRPKVTRQSAVFPPQKAEKTEKLLRPLKEAVVKMLEGLQKRKAMECRANGKMIGEWALPKLEVRSCGCCSACQYRARCIANAREGSRKRRLHDELKARVKNGEPWQGVEV